MLPTSNPVTPGSKPKKSEYKNLKQTIDTYKKKKIGAHPWFEHGTSCNFEKMNPKQESYH